MPGYERPITCLMYPLIQNRSGLWVLHYRSLTGVCRLNVGKGPWMIDVMVPSLRILFGAPAAALIVGQIKSGRDGTAFPSLALLEQYEHEKGLEKAQQVPTPRSGWPGLVQLRKTGG